MSETMASTSFKRASYSSSDRDVEDVATKTTSHHLQDLSDVSDLQAASDKPTLILAKGSSSNDNFECDALGIHYELSTPQSTFHAQRVSTISRWDAKVGRNVLVAEWERYMFKTDRIKMEALGAKEFVPVYNPLPLLSLRGSLGLKEISNRTFTAPNGNQYTWKSRPMSMKLFCSDGKEDMPIAAYHRGRRLIKAQKPFIELFDGYEDILDMIVVTCTIAVKKRKEGERRRAATSGGAGS